MNIVLATYLFNHPGGSETYLLTVSERGSGVITDIARLDGARSAALRTLVGGVPARVLRRVRPTEELKLGKSDERP